MDRSARVRLSLSLGPANGFRLTAIYVAAGIPFFIIVYRIEGRENGRLCDVPT
jgi:hypothetical protein